MSRIELNAEQRPVLLETIRDAISDLRMEIADTDSSAFRDALKRKEKLLKEILQRLDPSGEAAPHHPEFPKEEREC